MGIEIVNNLLPSNNTGKPLPTPNNRLGKNDFLQLLVTQLRYQDPTKPMSNEQFIAQTAEFSALEQMQDMNTNIKSLIDIQKASTRTEALSLIGKNVSTETISGIVEGITIEDDQVYVSINGENYTLSSVKRVQ
jgi:flagellar basal-body rod modification protein FlgD